jgi:hypothetical protein
VSAGTARAGLVLTLLVAGCAGLSATPVDDVARLAGTWRGRMSGPAGAAPVVLTIEKDGSYHGLLYVEPTYHDVRGVISVLGERRIRYEGSDGNGRVTFHEGDGRRVLRFVRDGGGGGAELTPER